MKYMNAISSIFLIIFVLTGCSTLGVGIQNQDHKRPGKYHKNGPPPHAPAHGYRHKNHDGYDLEYHSKIGAYVVTTLPETYFGNNFYIRMSSDGRWLVSTSIQGGWRPAAHGEVPHKLKSYYGKKKKKNPGKYKKNE